ncbi:acetyltransferase (GNAT) family protein [Rhodococcus sp. SMB37]|uniref:GNAT family N-acetyltransferase n=1 Tax=Rhodococcus sp. SMB37 TaxID=2512213 RepID=UPI001052DE8E|nr:GNAT family N-acetyltransferase [Rhodococcus sp. SMB37]TCN51336.1 acetyltransferase (GNAT) family protein [Rhodococcus sp. SMB37]
MATTNHDQVLDRREVAAALLRALERRHEVLDAIVESNDRAAAIAAIGSLLDTTDFCAEAVLALPLGRLTKAERKKIRAELDDLDAVVKWTTDSRPYATGEHFRLRPISEDPSDTELLKARCAEQLGDGSDEAVETERRKGAALMDDESGMWLVAEDLSGDEPRKIGFAFGELSGNEVEVRIWVRPEARKQGYGTATLKQARTELAAYFPGSTLIIRTPA